ncbi:acyl carrier protein [Paenibacillus woosongensis]|uniref:Acyl carrier protein n=1 Tax=Paenibacillus woosongensis TaxID=307580 RepID=A0AA95IE07_9BACL|nr:acyl carrier protein [Paenibacillus woosongensis]WHX50778.1 acyl carrier protein [Paenibacillus woosongensis]
MERLKKIIQDLCFQTQEINENTSLLTDLGFDSLQILRLLVEIENEYKFKISYDSIDYEIFNKYGELEAYVTSKIQS